MRKIIGVVALAAGFVLVASPPVHADIPVVLTLHFSNGIGGPTITNGTSVPAFATTTVGTPVFQTYTFSTNDACSVPALNPSPCPPRPVEVQHITNGLATPPPGFTVTQAVMAQGPTLCGGCTRTWILQCDAVAFGHYSGTVTVGYTINTVGSLGGVVGPATSTGTFSFDVSCQVDAPAAAPPAAAPPAAETPASVAPATKKKTYLPTVGSHPVLPLTATLMIGLGAIAIRLARRPQPLDNR